MGVRERQPAPVLLRGLEDDRLRDSSSSSAGRCRTASSARSPRARCSRRSPAGFTEWLDLGLVEGELPAFNGAQALGCSPVAEAYAEGWDVCQAAAAGARSRRALRSATRPTAPTRSSWRGGPAERSSAVTDDEIRAGIRLLAETTGIFTETAGGVTTAVLAKLARAGAIDSGERVVAVITGEGLKTLDAVREGFADRRDRADDRLVRGRGRVAGRRRRLIEIRRRRSAL